MVDIKAIFMSMKTYPRIKGLVVSNKKILKLDLKICSCCKKVLPVSDFYIIKKTITPTSRCKKCMRIIARERYLIKDPYHYRENPSWIKKNDNLNKKKEEVEKNMADEKHDNFQRLALGRTNKVLKGLSLLANLKTGSYHSTQEELDTITDTIQQGLNKLKGIYKPKTLKLEFK